MDNNTILESHIAFKKTSVHSKEKLQDIQRYIKKFMDSVNEPMNKVKEDDISKFISSLHKQYSIGTINDIKVYLKVFFKWYFSDWSSRFPNLENLFKQQKPPATYQPEQMVSFEEVEKMVKAEKDLMWKVYWLVFFYGGFRPSEACRLEWKQVYFEPEGTIIKIRTSKTNKDFYKSVPKNVEHLLKEWREYNHSEYLFPSPIKQGDTIKARTVCARLKRLSQRTLNKVVVPYALRHSIATILYNDDSRQDDDTARQLGHTKNMKNTYMNLDAEKIKTRARSLWIKTKKMTPQEKDRLKALERKNKLYEKQLRILAEGLRSLTKLKKKSPRG